MLLSPDAATAAREALEAIVRYLERSPPAEPGLLEGAAGEALFFYHLDHELAADRLADAAARVSAAAGASFHVGGPGVGWAIQYLGAADAENPDDDPNLVLDDVLLRVLERPWHGAVGLTDGLAGLGVYAIERLPHPGGAALLARVVERLADRAERRDDGQITWFSAPSRVSDANRAYAPDGQYDLGLAHGIPAVLPILAAAIRADIAADRARLLLDGAVRWLLAQRIDRDGSAFPFCIRPGMPPEPARSAWCFGDPGIAAMLGLAARLAGKAAWEAEAIALAHLAARRPVALAGAMDAGLCHGASGLAHMFHRMFRATGDGTFADAARTWFDRVLAMRRPDEGAGGYLVFDPHPPGSWVVMPGLLGGAAGIGLALQGALAEDPELSWDRALLLSSPLDA